MNLAIRPTLSIPEVPAEWDYQTSVEKIKTINYRWHSLTEEIITELWIAREKLTPRERTTIGAYAPMDKTWASYCQDIGVDKSTANRWLKAFTEGRKQVTEKPESEDVEEEILEEETAEGEKSEETGVLKDGQSHNLGLLKGTWVKTTKADRKRFLIWLQLRDELTVNRRGGGLCQFET